MFDVKKAKEAGYSDKEIAEYLADQVGFNLEGARKSGYSDTEIIGHLQAATPTSNADPVTATPSTPEAPGGFVRGMRDPLDAGGQLLEKVLPDSWAQNVNKFNNWLADKGIPLQRLPETSDGFDTWLREDERKYQQARAAGGETGLDGDRLAGNVLSPANLAIASKVPQAATLGGRVAAGAGGGAVMGALQPVTEGNPEDFWEEKGKQTAAGGVTGGALPVATGAVARVIKPKSSQHVQQLLDEGVTPTPGQALGGVFKTTEDKLTSLPVVGDAIRGGQKRALVQFNRAAINRILQPLGKKLPKNVNAGRDAFNHADDIVSAEYNKLLPKLKGKLDPRFNKEVDSLKELTRSMPKDKADQFQRILDNEVIGRFTDHGLAHGNTLKEIESKLGSMARGYMRSQDYDQRNLGGALRELQESMRRMIERNNPQHQGQLKRINRAYAHYKRAERAMSYVGTDDGLFTPSQFNSAVKALDPSKDKKKFAKGTAFGQDLSNAGKSVLAQSYPDSGTAGRVLTNALAVGGGAYIHPGTVAAAGAMSVPYLPGLQKAATGLLASRPGFAAPVAERVKKLAPYLTPAGIPVTQGLLE